jgi:hypothetical protein
MLRGYVLECELHFQKLNAQVMGRYRPLIKKKLRRLLMLQVPRLNFRMLLVGLLVLLGSISAFAQTSAIAGTVTDSAGAVVNGAQVSVKNVGTGQAHTVTTSGTGTYSITSLPVGVYEITVTKDGFKTFRVPDAQLTVGQTMGVNVKLEPGVVTEEIQVKADQLPDVDLEDAQVSNLVDSRQMKDLPLITRNPYELILLSPGTNQSNSRLGGISVNGSRERNNNFLLDGVDNNDASVPGGLGGVVGSDPESTQEFRVITDTFNAEYGRNTGAIVDVVTKSGTNAFHGDAYEFGRWNGFGGARDWFNTVGNPQDPYIRHQFGYSIGGPIIKNKTFFFFNQEFDRFITALSSAAVVPTAAFRTGQFTFTNAAGVSAPLDLTATGANNKSGALSAAFGGSSANTPIDPTMQKILALYPTPTSSVDGLTGLIFFPGTSRQKAYQATAKIDHHLTDRHFISLRYAYDPVSDPNPFHDDVLPGNLGATALKAIGQGVAANLTSTFSSTLVNSFSFGWNHSNPGFSCTGLSTLDQVSKQEGSLDRFGFGRDYTVTPFTGFGCLSLVANSQFRVAGTTSYTDSVSWVHGRHTFKFGGDFRDVSEGGADSFFSRRQVLTDIDNVFGFTTRVVGGVPAGTTTNERVRLDNAASALWGIVAEDLNGEFFTKGGSREGINITHFRQHEYDGYAQDTWKMRSNLTLTLGLRYQFDGVPYEENANFSNLLTNPASFAAGSPVVFSTVGPGTGRQLFNSDYSNIEPRIGFSWDPWGDGKTAIRGGFAIFHDRVFGNLFTNAKGNPPFELDYNTFPGLPLETVNNFYGSDTFPTVAPDTTPVASIPDGSHLTTPVIFDVHFRNPVSNNWNLGIQRELANNLTLDLTYQGSQSHHIFRAVDGNPPDPNLVNALLTYCSNPNNAAGCTTDNVSSIFLYEGFERGVLPFNAVANNALEQPVYNQSNGDANYNALEVKLTRRLSHGLQVGGSYTWSHANDNANDPIDAALGNRNFPRNSRNLKLEYGNSDNDVRHTAVINYVYELPLGKGKGYLNTGALGRILQGMQLSGITTVQTGHPFDIFSTTDSQRTGVSQRADLVGNPSAPGTNDTNGPSNGAKVWFRNPNAFAQPLDASGLIPIPGRPGTTGKNQFYGPGFVNFDMVWAKKMTFGERVGAELRAECYNIFNHPHFLSPTNGITSSFFGLITSSATRGDGTTSARQMQVALKVTF